MKLYEFFGAPTDNQGKKDERDEITGKSEVDRDKLADDVYWFMLDDDQLHKEYFLPLAKEIAAKQKDKKFDHGEYVKKWMPLVKQACKQFYKEHELSGDPDDVFPPDLIKGLCQRLADQHHKDIEKGEYKLG